MQRFIHVLIFIGLVSQGIIGQNIRMSEAEIQIQEQFLDAHSKYISGKVEDATKIYENLLIKNKKCDACAYELAKIYESKSDNVKAIEFAQKAVSIDSTNIWYGYLLADVLTKVSRDDEAAKVYAKMLLKNKYDKNLNMRYAFSLVRAGEPDKALKVYEDLETKFGIEEDLARKKLTIYIAKNDIPKAILELEKLINKYPTQAQYKYLLADFYESFNQKNKAAETYKSIIETYPNETDALLKLRKINGSSNAEKVDDQLAKAIENESLNIDGRIKLLIPNVNRLADKYNATQAEQLQSLVQKLLVTYPSDAKVNALAGDIYFHSNKIEEAIKYYKNAVKTNKTIFPVWEQLMFSLEQTGNYNELLSISNDVIELFPFQPASFYYSGLANVRLKKYETAEENLEQSIVVSGKNISQKILSKLELGHLYTIKGEKDKALTAFNKAIELNPGYSLTYMKLAKASVQFKEMDKAQENIAIAMKNGGESDPQVLNEYGDIFLLLNQSDKAIEQWQKAKNIGNKSILIDKKISEKKLYE
jgi:tetratricopeptide (TPR) repeat protein